MSNDSFDYNKEIEYFINYISCGIKSNKKKNKILEEINEHFIDSIYQKTCTGMNKREAFRTTCEAFGCMSEAKQLLAPRYIIYFSKIIKRLFLICCRIAISIYILFVIRGFIIPSGLNLKWFHYIPSICLIFGLWPIRFVKMVFSKIKMYTALKILCKQYHYKLKTITSLFGSVLNRYAICDYILKSNDKVYLIKTITSVNKKDSICILNNNSYVISSLRSGGNFVDRHPRGFNLVKIPDLTYSLTKYYSLSFDLPPSIANNESIQKILLIDSKSTDITHINGSKTKPIYWGNKIFSYHIHSKRSFCRMLGDNS